jgi:hypothetical protein
VIHLILHFLVPAVIVGVFYRETWKTSYLIMIATMLVDLDHVFASPIYDPGRCSIGFHPLHKVWFLGIYAILSVVPKTRLVGIGLVIHMALDSIDCQVTNGIWMVQD